MNIDYLEVSRSPRWSYDSVNVENHLLPESDEDPMIKREIREKCNIADLKDIRESGEAVSTAFGRFRVQENGLFPRGFRNLI